MRVEISEIELEQAPPELRLGTIDLIFSDEYDGHPRTRPVGVRFTLLHVERLQLVLPAAHPRAGDGAPVAVSALRDDVWAASERGTGHHAVHVDTCWTLGGTSRTCATESTTWTSSSNSSARRAQSGCCRP